jgi:hypothetical protein
VQIPLAISSPFVIFNLPYYHSDKSVVARARLGALMATRGHLNQSITILGNSNGNDNDNDNPGMCGKPCFNDGDFCPFGPTTKNTR